MIRNIVQALRSGEEGHAEPGVATLVGAIGAVVLAIGAAADTDWLTIVGGVVLGMGVLAAGILSHRVVDADLYGRIDKLEGK